MRFLTALTLFSATALAAFENVTSSDIPVPTNGTTSEDLSTAWVTDVETVTEFTTYCPEPTTIITNSKTIIVTEPTTLTITDCPCVITKTTPEAPEKPTETVVPPPAEETTEAEHTKETTVSTEVTSASSSSSHTVQTFDENIGNKVSGGFAGALACLALLLQCGNMTFVNPG